MSINTLDTPATSTPQPDSWETRIENAAVFLGIESQQVETLLKELGVEKDPAGMEMLSDEEVTPFGDLRKIFGDDLNIPLAKVRMAMKHLRGPKDSKKTDSLDPELVKLQNKYGVEPELSHIPTEQLLQDYHADKPDHPITLVLKERLGDKAVIVFKPDSTEVDIEATANYIADLEQGFNEEELIESQGKLVRLIPVGREPVGIVNEDPMFIGHPLKRDRSTFNRVNWSDVDLSRKQFVRLIVEAGEINIYDKRAVRDIMKDVNEGVEAGFGNLASTYPEVHLQFRERSKLNTLPPLVMSMKEASTANIQNPFGIGQNR